MNCAHSAPASSTSPDVARIVITPHITITADRDIEPPMVDDIHSVGGGIGVPRHDRTAHSRGLPHECTRVRSARLFRGFIPDHERPGWLAEARDILAQQYAAHDIDWRGWPGPA